jgi:cysteine synthase
VANRSIRHTETASRPRIRLDTLSPVVLYPSLSTPPRCDAGPKRPEYRLTLPQRHRGKHYESQQHPRHHRRHAAYPHKVWIKSERSNPGGSIKDRIALSMVEAAEKSGALKPGGTIVEPTSGNTGIGLAIVAAVRGYKLILVMPDSMSVERRRLMLAFGATFDLTPREKGMKGAIARAQEIQAATPEAWMPQQFDNPANIDVHARTTAQEIAADFPEGVDVLITGVGTGGHITGCAQVLKVKWPKLKVYAVEPTASPVISGGAPAPHPIQGIGAGFVPKNLDVSLLDGVIQVEAEAAREMGRRSAREEGILVGISSGATLAAIAQKLPEIPAGATVLGFNYDTGERYLSIEGFLPA